MDNSAVAISLDEISRHLGEITSALLEVNKKDSSSGVRSSAGKTNDTQLIAQIKKETAKKFGRVQKFNEVSTDLLGKKMAGFGTAALVVGAAMTKLIKTSYKLAMASAAYDSALNDTLASVGGASTRMANLARANKKYSESMKIIISDMNNNGGMTNFFNDATEGLSRFFLAIGNGTKLLTSSWKDLSRIEQFSRYTAQTSNASASDVAGGAAALFLANIASGQGTAMAYRASELEMSAATKAADLAGITDYAGFYNQLASQISTGSGTNALGINISEDIMQGYAQSHGYGLYSMYGDIPRTEMNQAYIYDMLKLYTDESKTMEDRINTMHDEEASMKRMGEVINDVANSLYSFDEVIQFNGKEYESLTAKSENNKLGTANSELGTKAADIARKITDASQTIIDEAKLLGYAGSDVNEALDYLKKHLELTDDELVTFITHIGIAAGKTGEDLYSFVKTTAKNYFESVGTKLNDIDFGQMISNSINKAITIDESEASKIGASLSTAAAIAIADLIDNSKADNSFNAEQYVQDWLERTVKGKLSEEAGGITSIVGADGKPLFTTLDFNYDNISLDPENPEDAKEIKYYAKLFNISEEEYAEFANKFHKDFSDAVKYHNRSFFGSDTKNIPEHAAGGIVTAPTLGITGEAGNEAIIPLDSGAGIKYLAEALAEADGGEGEITVNVTLNGQLLEMNDYNAKKLGDKLAAIIDNNRISRGRLDYGMK